VWCAALVAPYTWLPPSRRPRPHPQARQHVLCDLRRRERPVAPRHRLLGSPLGGGIGRESGRLVLGLLRSPSCWCHVSGGQQRIPPESAPSRAPPAPPAAAPRPRGAAAPPACAPPPPAAPPRPRPPRPPPRGCCLAAPARPPPAPPRRVCRPARPRPRRRRRARRGSRPPSPRPRARRAPRRRACSGAGGHTGQRAVRQSAQARSPAQRWPSRWCSWAAAGWTRARPTRSRRRPGVAG
jgi:hypothetical protein